MTPRIIKPETPNPDIGFSPLNKIVTFKHNITILYVFCFIFQYLQFQEFLNYFLQC